MGQPSEIFARSMREIRKSEGLTQQELALRVSSILDRSVDGTTITRIEKGQRALQLDEAAAIAKALGMQLRSMIPSEVTVQEEIDELERAEAEAHYEINRLDETRHELVASLTAVELRLQELRDQLARDQP